MKQVKVQEAVGMVLCHDITEIVPGKFKGRAFSKGHVIEEKDIEKLLDLGKQHIFVWDLEEGYVHENDAAHRIVKAAVGPGIELSEVKEGKIEVKASYEGILKINIQCLEAINSIDDICFATIHGNKAVTTGKVLGGTRVIPLVIKNEALERLEEICRENYPLIEVRPFKEVKIGIVTTGSEIKSGRIEDKFGPVLREKAKETKSIIMGQVFPGDDKEAIAKAIEDFIAVGADLVEVTGGMSVDPDDMTSAAIKSCGGEIITYGTPVLPGAMFMLAYVKGVPVVGLPGCVMYAKRSIFDLIVPRLIVGEKLSKLDFVKLGHGGQCQNCGTCVYPDCGFGS